MAQVFLDKRASPIIDFVDSDSELGNTPSKLIKGTIGKRDLIKSFLDYVRFLRSRKIDFQKVREQGVVESLYEKGTTLYNNEKLLTVFTFMNFNHSDAITYK